MAEKVLNIKGFFDSAGIVAGFKDAAQAADTLRTSAQNSIPANKQSLLNSFEQNINNVKAQLSSLDAQRMGNPLAGTFSAIEQENVKANADLTSRYNLEKNRKNVQTLPQDQKDAFLDALSSKVNALRDNINRLSAEKAQKAYDDYAQGQVASIAKANAAYERAANEQLALINAENEAKAAAYQKALQAQEAFLEKQSDNYMRAVTKSNASYEERANRELAEINKANEQKVRAQQEADDRAFAENVKANNLVLNETQKAQEEITRIQNAAEVSRLRSTGQNLEAELEQIRQNAVSKKSAVRDNLREQLQTPGLTDEGKERLTNIARDTNAAIDNAADQQREAAEESFAQKRLQNVRVVQDVEERLLQIKAASGEKGASDELRRIRSLREAESLEESLQEVLKDETLEAEKRLIIEEQIVAIRKAGAEGQLASGGGGGNSGGRASQQGTLGELYKLLGRGSPIGRTAQLLMGAGIGLVVDITARVIGDAADKLRGINEQLAAGTLSASQYGNALAEGLVTSIPILNSVYGAFKSIANAIDDSTVQEENFNKIRKGILEEQLQSVYKQIDAQRQLALEIRKTQATTSIASLGTGYSAELAQVKEKGRATLDQNSSARQAELDAIDRREKESEEKIREQAEAAGLPKNFVKLGAGQRSDIQKKIDRLTLENNASNDSTVTELQNQLRNDDAGATGFNTRQTLLDQQSAIARKDKADINSRWDAKDKADREAAAAEENAFLREHNRQALLLFESYHVETNKIRNATENDALTGLNQGLRAEFRAIQQSGEEKIAEIEKQVREQARALSPQNQALLYQEASRREAALRASTEVKNTNTIRDNTRGQNVAVLGLQASANDPEAAAELARIELANQYSEIESKILALKEAQRAEEQRLQNIKKNTVLDSKGQQIVEAALAENLNQQKLTQEDLNGLRQAARLNAEQQLRTVQEENLQSVVENGASRKDRLNAAKQLEEIKLGEELKRREQDTLKVLKNPKSTPEDKKAAEDSLRNYAKTTDRQFSRDVFGDQQPGRRTFDLQERGLLTGVRQSAESQRDPQLELLRSSKEGNAIMTRFMMSVDNFFKSQTNKPAMNPAAVEKDWFSPNF